MARPKTPCGKRAASRVARWPCLKVGSLRNTARGWAASSGCGLCGFTRYIITNIWSVQSCIFWPRLNTLPFTFYLLPFRFSIVRLISLARMIRADLHKITRRAQSGALINARDYSRWHEGPIALRATVALSRDNERARQPSHVSPLLQKGVFLGSDLAGVRSFPWAIATEIN